MSTQAAAASNFIPAARGDHSALPVTSKLRREVVLAVVRGVTMAVSVVVVMVVVVAPVPPAEPHVLTVATPARRQESFVEMNTERPYEAE